jgi:hypothetical protein
MYEIYETKIVLVNILTEEEELNKNNKEGWRIIQRLDFLEDLNRYTASEYSYLLERKKEQGAN